MDLDTRPPIEQSKNGVLAKECLLIQSKSIHRTGMIRTRFLLAVGHRCFRLFRPKNSGLSDLGFWPNLPCHQSTPYQGVTRRGGVTLRACLALRDSCCRAANAP